MVKKLFFLQSKQLRKTLAKSGHWLRTNCLQLRMKEKGSKRKLPLVNREEYFWSFFTLLKQLQNNICSLKEWGRGRGRGRERRGNGKLYNKQIRYGIFSSFNQSKGRWKVTSAAFWGICKMCQQNFFRFFFILPRIL